MCHNHRGKKRLFVKRVVASQSSSSGGDTGSSADTTGSATGTNTST